MKDYELETIRVFAEIARPIIRASYGPNSCIASTRIVIDVLTRFGLQVQPVSVMAEVWNRAYHECRIRAGRQVQSQEELDRWMATAGACVGRVGTDVPGEWSGHVVAIAGRRVLVDAAIDQANRPEWDIIVPGVLVTECGDGFLRCSPAVCQVNGGSWVTYRPTSGPGANDFMRSEYWVRSSRNRGIAKQIERQMGTKLTQSPGHGDGRCAAGRS